MLDGEIKTLIEDQGKAFDAFKATHDEQIKELKKGVADPVVTERMSKIEASLDKAVEAKAALEAGLAAERKEREELELRLSKLGKLGSTDEKKAVAIDKLNNALRSAAASRGQPQPEPLDEKGFDAYESALGSYLRKGRDPLDATEIKTLSVGSDPDGGYLVTPDTSGRMVKRVFETSPVRQIANVTTISTDRMEGIEDLNEAGVGYSGETVQSGDTTTPQISKWAINVYWIDTEPKTTQQILDDANIDVEAWLSEKVGDKFGRWQNAEFINGNAGKIRGLMSSANTYASDAGAGVAWGSVGYFPTGAAGDWAATNPADALLGVIGVLKNDYQNNASWLASRLRITEIRKFKDSTGQYLWQPSLVAGVPETLLGFPVARAEDMPAKAANSHSVAFGDFKQAYQIVDRQGITVLRDVFTQKPFVKFYTRARVGGGIVNFEAFKTLRFATS